MYDVRIRKLCEKSTNDLLTQIQSISVTDKRKFFSLLRMHSKDVDEHWIYPLQAISVGELCVAQVLDSDSRKRSKQNQDTSSKKRKLK